MGEGSIAISFVHRALHEQEEATMADATCAHIEAITTVKHAKRRRRVRKDGARWVHLRNLPGVRHDALLR